MMFKRLAILVIEIDRPKIDKVETAFQCSFAQSFEFLARELRLTYSTTIGEPRIITPRKFVHHETVRVGNCPLSSTTSPSRFSIAA